MGGFLVFFKLSDSARWRNGRVSEIHQITQGILVIHVRVSEIHHIT